MRLPQQLRSAAATIRRRTPHTLEWAGLALIAYGASRYSLNVGLILAGVFLVLEAVTSQVSR